MTGIVSRERETVSYTQPPRDQTLVKILIVRPCWVKLPGTEAMRTAHVNEVLQLPRWLADELAANGKASLV